MSMYSNNAPPGSTTGSSKAQSSSSGRTQNAGSVTKRLQSELMSLMMSPPKGVTGFPDADNIFRWVASITGVSGTVYEGLKYKLTIQFPDSYPYTPPTVRFETPCFHPNVDQHGNICLDILKENWSAVYNATTVLLSIQTLLGDPNNDSPLNGYAAALWDNQEEYKTTLLAKYKKEAESSV
eukprot:TRINITY_DN15077_c0_g1_i1.p1 TRINITY_DN15077_c0_g1~~TRINITY_DN15077_c0_g1_i1.p1  ORF type:complete len:181 (-),score=38.37 TRINITY_DN15077_c0_g1_i1:246-788(-)